MKTENGGMYGVCPGSVAGSGATPNEAFIDFRNRYKETLFDIAEECKGFLLFHEAVKDFYTEDKQENARWEEALDVLRKNEEMRDGAIQEYASEAAR